MQCFTYLIYNIINGKLYVGKTNNPSHRWSKHKYVAKHKFGTPQFRALHKAIKKYGAENFIFKVVEIEDKEIEWYDLLKEYKYSLYNEIRPIKGGFSPRRGFIYPDGTHPWIGRKHSEESKNKNRQSHLGKPGNKKGKHLTEDIKEKIRQANVGKTTSEETRQKLSIALAGEKNPSCKITREIVQQIRQLYSTGEYSQRDLAKLFNISKGQIYNIVNFISWK